MHQSLSQALYSIGFREAMLDKMKPICRETYEKLKNLNVMNKEDRLGHISGMVIMLGNMFSSTADAEEEKLGVYENILTAISAYLKEEQQGV